MISEIQNMSPEELAQARNELRAKCISSGHELPEEEVNSLLNDNGGMTMQELKLRAALQADYFDKLSVDVLQSHFTYFYQRNKITENLVAMTKGDRQEQLKCDARVTLLIVDELGKSLLRKGVQPQVPPNKTGQKV